MRQHSRIPARRTAIAGAFGRLSSVALFAGLLAATPALADKIAHPTAVFNGLDKITGRIIAFEVAINETVQFGSLYVTPRVCYSRPATETPQTTSFIEVEDKEGATTAKKIFAGWMFASSPGLNAVEHPVYDVWLTDCKGGSEIIRDAKATPDEPEEVEEPVKPAARPAARKPPAPRRPAQADGAPPPARTAQPQRPVAQPQQQRGPIDIGRPPGFIPR